MNIILIVNKNMLTKEILLQQQKELIKEYSKINKEINNTKSHAEYDELFQKRMIVKELILANNSLVQTFKDN